MWSLIVSGREKVDVSAMPEQWRGVSDDYAGPMQMSVSNICEMPVLAVQESESLDENSTLNQL
jgi:hypothetical protein